MLIPPLSPLTPLTAPVSPVAVSSVAAVPEVSTVDISPLGEILAATASTVAEQAQTAVSRQVLPNQVAATNELQHVLADEALQAAITESQASVRSVEAPKPASNSAMAIPVLSPAISSVTAVPVAPEQPAPAQSPTAQAATNSAATPSSATNLAPPNVDATSTTPRGRFNTVDVHFAATDPSIAAALAAYHLNDGPFRVSAAQAEMIVRTGTPAVVAVQAAEEVSLDPHEQHPPPFEADPNGHHRSHHPDKEADERDELNPGQSTIDVIV